MQTRQEVIVAVQAARQQARAQGGTVLDALVQATQRHPEQVAQALRAFAGVEAIDDPGSVRPDWSRMPQVQARAMGVVPLRRVAAPDALLLAMSDPWDEQLLQKVSRLLAATPVAAAAPRAMLATWLEEEAGRPVERASVSSNTSGGEGPVVAFVDKAILTAYSRGASDVHFESSRQGVLARLRCDGVLNSLDRLGDAERAEQVISRIKVLAQLDITEKRLPQDGRFRMQVPGGEIDLRVSIIPSVFGEDAVLRLLDKAQLRDPSEQVSLDRLGFDPASAEKIRELAELPHGMLLVTGPTGSGKTTTVYAALSEVNSGFEKIITIEDPVEYELAGVLQVPVNERKGLTFAKGLRSVLRHDPDRILVGEIRDGETAEIAVQSALTGHQVLTTIHANSIFDVTGRFKHFGLDMFGFMSALNGVIVQRLVRCLCQRCASEREAQPRELRWLRQWRPEAGSTVPLAVGCEDCGGSGYKGRRVIAEVHAVDDGLRDLVTSGSPVSVLREHVYGRAGASLSELGAGLVMQRLTSVEEIKRVVGW